MGFLGVYKALYDYAPQADGELAIDEGDLLYVLEKNDDDGWWKAKKKAGAEDEDEPIGLIPNNYVEEVPNQGHARALYEYTRQTDEELSFPEDAVLDVFDTSDPDWILVGLDDDYGFVPSNYIDMSAISDDAAAEAVAPAPPALPSRPQPAAVEEEPQSPVQASPPRAPAGPAAALAGVMAGRAVPPQPSSPSPPPQPQRSFSQHDDYQHASDDESARSPALPSRPRPPRLEVSRSPPPPPKDDDVTIPPDPAKSPGGFHLYNINEMVSIMGKRKKMPTTLGINLRTGIILIAPEYAQDGPSQEWTADRMTHYSREGKHVFMELVRPSKSIDFHAGAKDTAEEIVMSLGEMAGAVRAEGLREVIMAGSKQGMKKGHILYDFTAQGEDEVSVSAGDEVFVVDDSKSEEWWQVRRLKNGKEGVVPSSYIEVTGTVAVGAGQSDYDNLRSTVEQNRLDELRLTKEALKASKEPEQVGHGVPLPARGSSLAASENGNNSGKQRSRRENGRGESSGQAKPKAKPDPSKVRTWTDRSKSFSVDAQFLGLKDSKIHLHKMNGVKIAVPIAKMSRDDLEYVENLTGIPLQTDDATSSSRKSRSPDKATPAASSKVEKNKKPEYDWFQFFLDCDIAVGLCERYAQAFIKDSMDESVLPDVDAVILRNLGLREGDIIKVMRTLDNKFGRQRAKDGDGGLFSGAGGTLRNNTRKGRPAPAVQTSDVVDAAAFSKGDKLSPAADESKSSPTPASPVKANNTNAGSSKAGGGFDDDAWDVKPSKQPSAEPKPQSPAPAPAPAAPAAAPAAPPSAPLTGSMKELSLLSEPLQPTKVEGQPQPTQPTIPAAAPQLAPQATAATQSLQGANPNFFSSLPPPQQAMATGVATAGARQRPTPPQPLSPQNSLVPPPPQRPLSAPLSAQQSAFASPGLVPQMTGGLLQSQVAPTGQSLNEITQVRQQQLQQQQLQQQQLQQQQQLAAAQLQPAYTGFQGAQQMGYSMAPAAYLQPMMTGAPNSGPFMDPSRPQSFSPMQAQPTGFQQFGNNMQNSFSQPNQGQGINNFLPPALEPQRTGMPGIQAQPTGINSFNPQQATQQQPVQPLQPQQTGPAPPVRFGVTPDTKKLVPQATGRRANLSQATPENPFGF
ncbi:unnamed protein product [Clonostachys rosea f. rosea IK726]|uniref:Uncharacterized protein n=1 Tax=Clonostachys rosea f. rosea IK726 TaxID=1349383 RepID=A0ACA9TEU6_BIOOC|nr:unnamed protein product [Clonostachys rosea f. rosea IK726]